MGRWVWQALCGDPPPISIKTWVEDAAAAHGTAVLHGGHRPPLVYAGPYFIPGINCCYECFSRSRMHPGIERLDVELGMYRDIEPPMLLAVGWGDTAAATLIAGQSVQWLAGIASIALLELELELELDLCRLKSRWMDGHRRACVAMRPDLAPKRRGMCAASALQILWA